MVLQNNSAYTIQIQKKDIANIEYIHLFFPQITMPLYLHNKHALHEFICRKAILSRFSKFSAIFIVSVFAIY